ncbi:hypothetical protein L7F22_064486 [Adiantum nelumboides]|nr:hypothetical protein [Adiantum nelumboides]
MALNFVGCHHVLFSAALLCIFIWLPPNCRGANAGKEYTVGDSSGWNTGVDYSSWASQHTFHIGDSLKFTYATGVHTVQQVAAADYKGCNSANAIMSGTSGTTTVKLDKAQTYYFICGAPGHCEGGMQLSVTGLKIATPQGQDAPLSTDIPREPCQGFEDCNVSGPRCSSVNVPRESCQGATLKKVQRSPKVPNKAQSTKQGLNLVKGSGALKVKKRSVEVGEQHNGQTPRDSKGSKKRSNEINRIESLEGLKEWSSKEEKRHSTLGATQDTGEQKKGQGRCERKKVKVKGHTSKGQLKKVTKVEIALKKNSMKKKTKKHVEKRLEDEELADKALVLVNSSKRFKLQVKRAKQSGVNCYQWE